MRKVNLFTLFLIVSCMTIVAVFVSSCSDCLQSRLMWKRNLEASIGRSIEVSNSRKTGFITLSGYKYYGPNVCRYDKVMDKIFASDRFVVFQSNVCGKELIYDKVSKWGEYGEWANDRLDFCKKLALSALSKGTGLVELEWIIDGETTKTLAIVHYEQGILYDNICNFIVDDAPKATLENSELVELNALQNRGEANLKKQIFSKSDSRMSLFGTIELWYYKIYCETIFDSSGKLYDRRMMAESRSDKGWKCDANIQTIGGRIAIDSHHEFAWGYGYSEGDVTITWTGTEYSVSVSSTGENSKDSGREVHRW